MLDHIDGILVFPLAGRAREDVRPGMRTTTFKKKTLVAYEIDESAGEFVAKILGIFHGGQDWDSAFARTKPIRTRVNGARSGQQLSRKTIPNRRRRSSLQRP